MKLFAGLVVVGSATECDPCWQLQADGECHPNPAYITTTCDSSSITVNVDECVFGNRYVASDVYVGDDASNTACQLSANGESMVGLTHGLTECGMTVSYDDANGILNFVSRMTVPGLQDPTSQIVTTQSLDWSFTCQYDASYEIQEDEMTMNTASKSSGFTSTGQFNLALNTYNSTDFDHLLDVGNKQLQIGQRVNFGIAFNDGQKIDGLVFAPTTCRVINSADTAETFRIWDAASGVLAQYGQCAKENNPVGFEILQYPDHSERAFWGMWYSGFGFNSVDGDSQNQQIQCQIEICLADSENSACNSGCLSWDTSVLEPVFGEWTEWSSCSETCGAGERTRSRQCTDSCDNIDTSNADHDLTQAEDCDAGACPVLEPVFGEWTEWSSCSQCGGGSQTRTRECTASCENIDTSNADHNLTEDGPCNYECGVPCAESSYQYEIESRILTPGSSSTLGLCQTDTSNPRKGVLMVKKNGIWGSVCDDKWPGSANAQAACRSLGYSGGTFETINQGRTWVEEIVPIVRDDVACLNSYQWFETCGYNPNENCGHNENVLLTCDSR